MVDKNETVKGAEAFSMVSTLSSITLFNHTAVAGL